MVRTTGGKPDLSRAYDRNMTRSSNVEMSEPERFTHVPEEPVAVRSGRPTKDLGVDQRRSQSETLVQARLQR
jgi:hypothetical protein